MKKAPVIALLCALLLLSACGSQTLAEEDPLLPYQADYELLWQELETSYPYLPYLESRGIDVAGIRERYAGELEGLRDEADFAGLLQRMLAELGNFAHLNLVSPEMYQSYYYAYLLDDALKNDPQGEPFRALLQDPRLSARYQAPNGPEGGRQTGTLPEVTVLYYPDCRALHLKNPSFRQELVERDRNVVAEALEKYPDAEHILFDITGNTGGSDWYWMQNLVAPFGGSYPFRFRVYSRDTQTRQRFYSGLETLPVSALTDAPDWVSALGLTQYFATQVVLPEESEGGKAVQSSARRWLLVDGAVFSASEKFACFCKASAWATLVGTRTAGDGLGTTPVLLLLPESGLLLRFSADAGEGPDGTMNAARGTAPDILCIRGQLPLNRCLEQIRAEG